MNITFEELRQIKHKLPTGSVRVIAQKLNMEEQTIRNYFGANKFQNGEIVSKHIQPGPNGGIVHIDNDDVINLAREIIRTNNMRTAVN